MNVISTSQYSNKSKYENLEMADSKAKLGFGVRLTRLFCCFGGDTPVHELKKKTLLKKFVTKKSDPHEDSLCMSRRDLSGSKGGNGSKSPSRASTDTSGSRTPSPNLSLGYGTMHPSTNVLFERLRGGNQTMGHAIHGTRVHDVVVHPVLVVQPNASKIEELRKFVNEISAAEPVIRVSHQIENNFQVTIKYTTKDGPIVGAKRTKTYLIPSEEIRKLGGSESTTTIDLGANLRAHLKANFSFIDI